MPYFAQACGRTLVFCRKTCCNISSTILTTLCSRSFLSIRPGELASPTSPLWGSIADLTWVYWSSKHGGCQSTVAQFRHSIVRYRCHQPWSSFIDHQGALLLCLCHGNTCHNSHTPVLKSYNGCISRQICKSKQS